MVSNFLAVIKLTELFANKDADYTSAEPGSVPMTIPNTYSSTSASQLSRAAESHIVRFAWNIALS